MNTEAPRFRVRSDRADDHAFVAKSWRDDFGSSPDIAGVDRADYRDRMLAYVERMVARPGAELQIACAENDEDAIFGWALIEGATLHYVYVRGGENSMRGHGIMRALTGAHRIDKYSHRNGRWKAPAGWRFVPAWLEA